MYVCPWCGESVFDVEMDWSEGDSSEDDTCACPLCEEVATRAEWDEESAS